MVIRLKRSAIPGKAPQATDLELGELAINTHDGTLFLKKDDGAEAIVEIGAGGGAQTFHENDPGLETDLTLAAGRNILAAGPITIGDGVTLTIPATTTWTVVGG